MAIDTNIIFAAADALAAAGKKVSIRAVYDQVREMGEKGGSFNDYIEPLRAWRNRQSTAVVARTASIPESLEQRMRTAFGEIWLAASAEASAQLEDQRQALEQERAAMLAEQQDLADAAQAMANQVELLQAEKQALLSQLDQVRAAGEQATAELQATRIQLAEITAQKQAGEERTRSVEAELTRSLASAERYYEEARAHRLTTRSCASPSMSSSNARTWQRVQATAWASV